MSGNTVLELAGAGNGSRVVNSGSAVKGRDITSAGLVDAVGKTITIVGTSSAFANHLVNGVGWARVANITALIASSTSVVVLHQAGIANSIVGGGSSNTSARLLHDDSQDEAVVNTSCGSCFLNAVPDSTL